eukprot:1391542-Prorocentrum_lima.AAC.1
MCIRDSLSPGGVEAVVRLIRGWADELQQHPELEEEVIVAIDLANAYGTTYRSKLLASTAE